MTYTDKPVTSHAPRWNFDMSAAPVGGKLLALNPGGVACFAVLSSHNKKDFQAWCPLPKVKASNNTDRLKAAAFDEWIARTDWVQEDKRWSFIPLGMHRADMMRKEIELLRAKVAALEGLS